MISIYVSAKGNDNAQGTKEEPFLTIQKAQEKARKCAKNMTDDVTVWIGGGFYELQEPISFTEEDSGQNGFHVTYRSLEGEEAILSGGRRFDKGELREGGCYAYPDCGGTHTLYGSANRYTEARYPKQGYLKATGGEMETLQFAPGKIPVIQDRKNLKVTIWPGGPEGYWNWFTNTVRVKEMDYTSGTITLENPLAFTAGAGSRYFLHGSRDFLQAPGEFYRDEDANETLVIPFEGNNPPEVVLPVAPQVIHCTGVHNLIFKNLTIGYTDAMDEVVKVLPEYYDDVHDGAVWIQDCRGLSVENCKILNTGFHGVFLKGYNEYIQVKHCQMRHMGHTGIQVQGIYQKDICATKHHTFCDNDICYCGELVGHGAGIQIIQCSDTLIAHNTISHTNRYGISMKGTTSGKSVGDVTVTRENMKEYSLCRRNIVEYNDVSYANMDSQDTGMVESWGVGDCTIRLHDLQHHGKGEMWNGIFVKGKNHMIRGNVAVNNYISKGVIGSIGDEWDIPSIKKCEYNIVYHSGHPIFFHNYNEGRFAESEHNLFSSGDNSILLKVHWEDEPEAISIERWREEYGFDRSSVLEDPCFFDAQNGDFRLKSESPYLAFGYRLPDFSKAGVRKID